jgi:PhnB protein
MSADPLDMLRDGDRPRTPRAAFAAQLRQELLEALDAVGAIDAGAAAEPVPETDEPTPRSTAMTTDPTTTIATTLAPYLIVSDGRAAIAYYERAFGAATTMVIDQPDGRVGHAELSIAGATFSLADEFPELDIVGPTTLGNSSVALDLVVPDVDAVVERAVAAGGTLSREVAEQFYGARSGRVVDPFGHRWNISTPGEQVSNEELQRRADEIYGDDA